MLIVLPFFNGDRNLAESVLEWINELGGVSRHDLLLVVPPGTEFARAQQLGHNAFKSSSVYQLPMNVDRWPIGPNYTFQMVCAYVDKMDISAWYFFEPDCTPLKSTWADDLDYAHGVSRKAFLGVKHRTINKLANGEFVEKGEHMVGTGIYPRYVSRYVNNLTKFLPVGKYKDEKPIPFDVFLQWEILKIDPRTGRHAIFEHTNLIQHNWSTENYRIENGKIVCDCRHGILNEPINFNCVVHHGCKDGTLIPILRGLRNKTISLEATPQPPKTIDIPKPSPEPPALIESIPQPNAAPVPCPSTPPAQPAEPVAAPLDVPEEVQEEGSVKIPATLIITGFDYKGPDRNERLYEIVEEMVRKGYAWKDMLKTLRIGAPELKPHVDNARKKLNERSNDIPAGVSR